MASYPSPASHPSLVLSTSLLSPPLSSPPPLFPSPVLVSSAPRLPPLSLSLGAVTDLWLSSPLCSPLFPFSVLHSPGMSSQAPPLTSQAPKDPLLFGPLSSHSGLTSAPAALARSQDRASSWLVLHR